MENLFTKFLNIVSNIKNEQLDRSKIIAKDRAHLEKLIKKEIAKNGNKCDLNHIDVSNIKDMARLFNYIPDFNGNISKWDTSNVENMFAMFENSKFNGDISNWNVSKVWNMAQMFQKSNFNNDISNWDASNVTSMEKMFCNSSFTQDISIWQPYKLSSAAYAFSNCKTEPPYWINYVDTSEREKIVNLHQSQMNNTLRNLSNKLGVNLNNKPRM